jgi:hypothetical protein
MSRLDRLTEWTAGGTSLRKLDRAGAGDPAEEPMAQATAYEAGDDLESEVGRQQCGMESDDAVAPAESLPVYRSVGYWRDREGAWCKTTHGFASEAAFARGECVLGQGSHWQEAAALSYLALPIPYFLLPNPPAVGAEFQRRNPHDVRPALLLLMYGEDLRALSTCIQYGANYLQAWCTSRGKAFSKPAKLAAAGDALSLIFRTRGRRGTGRRTRRPNTPSLAERSRQFGGRNADYQELRALMVATYLRRLREAEERFLECANYTAPKTGNSHGSGFAVESWWHPERSPPTDPYTQG